MNDNAESKLDVIVIGGGAAGLSGALMLARSRRSVLVIDSGMPRNAPANGVHGFLGHDGIAPSELLRLGREEVARYGGQIIDGVVTAARHDGESFVVSTEDGNDLRARRLLVATGLTDVLPKIPGLRERWGRDVIHCPYCHGWEVRDRAIGILATGPMSIHQAMLFRQLTDDLVYFSNGTSLDDEHRVIFAARRIRVIEGNVVSVEVRDDALAAVKLADGSTEPRDVVVVATRLEARAPFLDGLGLTLQEHEAGVGCYVKADQTGQSEIPGVWAAGNVTDLSAQVGGAAAAGALAGARINADLVEEDTRLALATG